MKLTKQYHSINKSEGKTCHQINKAQELQCQLFRKSNYISVGFFYFSLKSETLNTHAFSAGSSSTGITGGVMVRLPFWNAVFILPE